MLSCGSSSWYKVVPIKLSRFSPFLDPWISVLSSYWPELCFFSYLFAYFLNSDYKSPAHKYSPTLAKIVSNKLYHYFYFLYFILYINYVGLQSGIWHLRNINTPFTSPIVFLGKGNVRSGTLVLGLGRRSADPPLASICRL